MTTNARQSETKSSGRRLPALSRRRWIIIALLVPVLIALGAWITWKIVSHSSFLVPRLETALSELVGGEVSIGRAQISTSGLVTLHDLDIDVRGVPGAASRLIRIDTLESAINRRELITGNITLRRVTVEGVTLRISEDVNTGAFNFGQLDLSTGPPSEAPVVLPRIIVDSATIEMGQHDGSDYTSMGTLAVHGEMRREPALSDEATDDDWYAFEIFESSEPNDPDAPAPVRLSGSGRVNLATGQASAILRNVSFEPHRSTLLPSAARRWWAITQPTGTLQPVVVQVHPGGAYEVEILMDGIDWSLPVPAFTSMSPSEAPRMLNTRGTIIIGSDGAHLIGLSGEIDQVRYRLRGDFDRVDLNAGFDLTFSAEQFDIGRNLSLLTVFPDNVRSIIDSQLVELGGPTGRVDAKINLHRDAPPSGTGVTDGNRRVEVSGSVELSGAEGTYAGFPYPLAGITGTVEFDEDELRIINVAGAGPDGGRVFISGSVAPLGPNPAVDIEMYAVDLPLDDNLEKALGERHGRTFRQFINDEAAERLNSEGVFLTTAQVEQLRQEIASIQRSIREFESRSPSDLQTEEAQELAAWHARLTTLETRVQKPVFDLGGRIDLRSTIKRDRGPDEPVRVSNRIRLADPSQPIGLMYRDFPYPMYLADGELLIAFDRIEILQDFVLIGPTGSRALVSGEAQRIREPERRLERDFRVTATEVPIDNLLAHAIPGKGTARERDGLSQGARVLMGLRLDGRAVVDGSITTDDHGKAQYDLSASLSDAQTAAPSPTTSAVDDDELSWPSTFALTNIHAQVDIQRHGLALNRFTGKHGNEIIDASGHVDWSGDDVTLTLDVSGANIVLHPHLIDLAAALTSAQRLETIHDFWDRFRPGGIADIALKYSGQPGSSDGDAQATSDSLDLTVYPQRGSIALGSQTANLSNVAGSLAINESGLRFQEFRAQVESAQGPQGRITLNGQYGWTSDSPTEINGSIQSAHLESNVLHAAIEEFNDGKRNDVLDRLNAAGRFDAQFSVKRQEGSANEFRAMATPYTLAFDWSGERFELANPSGTIEIAPKQLLFHEFEADYQDGRLAIDGGLFTDEQTRADFLLSISAPSLTSRVHALLPQAVNRFIDALELEVTEEFRLTDARVKWSGQTSPSAADESTETDAALFTVESIAFNGLINIQGAALRLSLPITHASGSLDIDVQRAAQDQWFSGSVDLNVDDMRLMNRQVNDVSARLETTDEPGLIAMPRLVGRCYGGYIAASGQARLPGADRAADYLLDLSLSRVPIDPVLYPAKHRERLAGIETRAARTQGLSNGRLTLSGRMDDATYRRGRGSLHVDDAQLYEVPLAMWALQLSALSVPVSTSFRSADIEFFVDGETIVFEDIELESPTLRIHGDGTLHTTSRGIDLRFVSEGKLTIPLLSDLWMWLRDSVVALRITGTLDEPVTSLRSASTGPDTARPPTR